MTVCSLFFIVPSVKLLMESDGDIKCKRFFPKLPKWELICFFFFLQNPPPPKPPAATSPNLLEFQSRWSWIKWWSGNRWQVTGDRWKVTHDTLHMACDTLLSLLFFFRLFGMGFIIRLRQKIQCLPDRWFLFYLGILFVQETVKFSDPLTLGTMFLVWPNFH